MLLFLSSFQHYFHWMIKPGCHYDWRHWKMRVPIPISGHKRPSQKSSKKRKYNRPDVVIYLSLILARFPHWNSFDRNSMYELAGENKPALCIHKQRSNLCSFSGGIVNLLLPHRFNEWSFLFFLYCGSNSMYRYRHWSRFDDVLSDFDWCVYFVFWSMKQSYRGKPTP